jgi:PilZ domain
MSDRRARATRSGKGKIGRSKLKELRASRRYKLALQIEIRLDESNDSEPIFGRTCDISTHGFYFRIGQGLIVGMKIGFSIMPPWEEATHAFITGRARVVRIEEVSDGSIDHVGVGAVIEAYKFGQAESSAC